MRKSKIIIYISVIVIYLFMVNLIANFISSNDFSLNNISISETIFGGQGQKIGIGSSVSVTINRQHVYGNVIEEGGNSKLYLLNFIPIPLKTNGINFIFAHIIFALIIVLLLYRDLGKTRENRRDIDNRMNQYNKFPSPNFNTSKVKITDEDYINKYRKISRE